MSVVGVLGGGFANDNVVFLGYGVAGNEADKRAWRKP
jgi:hypothetical protein